MTEFTQDCLTKHKALVSKFLTEKYDQFFEKYTQLLNSTNYVTKRQSLKLLGELLLDRTNFNIMAKYIAVGDNLKLMMNLLRDKSRNIQFEAFHVFKVSPVCIDSLSFLSTYFVTGELHYKTKTLNTGLCSESFKVEADP
jgi:Mo25-like